MEGKELPILNFSYNWNNKLDCKSFTTIRLHNPKKYQFGREFVVRLNKQLKQRTAKVVDIRSIKLNELNEFIARIDTGYSLDECVKIIKKMYKNMKIDWRNQRLDFILLAYTESPVVLQKELEL